jgi:glycine hydroxymethyltransferase
MLIDLRPFNITGKEMEKRLDEVHITVNKNSIPNDPEKPFVTSGIRVGTPAVTSRGFKEEDMKQIATWMKEIATDFEGNRERITKEVIALCEKHPIYD